MPSPVGHALGGLALAWHLVPRGNRHAALVLAGIAIAPDLDLLVGDHRGISHSVGAAAVAGLIALAVTRNWRWALASAIAYASHVLFDWLSNDTRPPIGVMALWPFTYDYYKSNVEIFLPTSRRYWESRFWVYNLRAGLAEIAILGPIVFLVTRRRK